MISRELLLEIASTVEQLKADYYWRMYQNLLTSGPDDDRADADSDDDWVTVNGTHVLLGEGGVAQSGGKLKGKTFANAKSQKKLKKQTVQQAKAAFKQLSRKEQREYLVNTASYWGNVARTAKAKDLDWIAEKYFSELESEGASATPIPTDAVAKTPQSATPVAQGAERAKTSAPKRAQAGHKPNAQQIQEDYNLQCSSIAKDCGVTMKTAEGINDALQNYLSSGSYLDVRLVQQVSSESEYEKKSETPWMFHLSYDEAKDTVKKIGEYIDKAPVWNGGTLYRRIEVSPEEAESIVRSAKSGATIDQRGISSWTSDDITQMIGRIGSEGKTQVIYKTPGTKQGTSVNHLNHNGEGEVLISDKARWKASKVYKQDGAIIIECEEQ